MASVTSLQTAWSILTELDTRALRDLVQAPFPVAILSQEQADRQWLADTLRTDPFTGELTPLSQQIALYQLPLDKNDRLRAARARLAFLPIAAGREDVSVEDRAIAELLALNSHLPIVVVQIRPGAAQEFYTPLLNVWQGAREIVLDPQEEEPFSAEFVPVLKTFVPEQEILLGYHFPALRPALARQLIRQTAMTNATYSATTGLAELVPVLLIPGNMADFVVLTKNQGLMAYKIALLMGNDIAMQEMIGELAGVLGGGFLWRETARRLVGFVPGWGLIPKIAVAYAGTYIIGEATYYWYAYHEHLTAEQMRALYAKAVTEGRQKAAGIIAKMKKEKREPSLDAPRKRWALPRPTFRKKKQLPPENAASAEE
jgi:uncharacterized protein (DUF697 family)